MAPTDPNQPVASTMEMTTQDWPHSKIHSAALLYIRKHTMDESEWLYTRVDAVHESLAAEVELAATERPLVSCYVDPFNWYVMSTGRFFGIAAGEQFSVSPVAVREWSWGNFKHAGKAELETAHIRVNDGSSVSFMYETGKASMAPIYYVRFWDIKYPILHKLAE